MEPIGNTISRLRKTKGITQEELATAMQISPQAVSRWENGGLPDIELLPKIADYFEVSLDTLFGRNNIDFDNLDNRLARKIVSEPPEDRFRTAFELCWVIERALYGSAALGGGSIKDVQEYLGEKGTQHSSVLTEEGYTLMGLSARLPYFLLAPEPADKDAYLEGIDFPRFFADLADKTFFDTLVFFYKREDTKAFSPNLIMKNIGVEFDEAFDLIKRLHSYGLIHMTKLEMEDCTQEWYTFRSSAAFPALLLFAREFVQRPQSFSHYLMGRAGKYL